MSLSNQGKNFFFEYYLTIENYNSSVNIVPWSVKILQLKRLVFGRVSSLDKQQEQKVFARKDSLAEKIGFLPHYFPSASNFLR